MRIRPSWLMFAAALVGLSACTIKQVESETDGGLSGTGGSGGAGVGGTAGAAGDDHGACGDVPSTGKCEGNTLKVCLISDSKDEPEKVITTDCGANRTCKDDAANGFKAAAKCEQIGECNAGETSCKDDKTLLTCSGTGADAKWTSTTCDVSNGEKCLLGKPGTPASCVALPNAGSKERVHGRIQFESRPVGSNNLSWGGIKVEEAVDVYVGFFDGDQFIGRALAGWDPAANDGQGGFTNNGEFWADLEKPLTAQTQMWVWAMAFNYETGNPLMAVAKATGTSLKGNAQGATDYWAWGDEVGALGIFQDGSPNELKPYVIKESEGSGALNVYQWIDFGLQRTGGLGPQMSLIVYWSPQFLPECGACFCGTQCGGGQVKYGPAASDVDQYDSWIAMGGPDGDETQWASSVISHEFGHYVMANNSLSPGEGGPHYLGQPSKPGLAYSEAWATAFGQSNISSPIYVDQQEGTFFWVDISKYTYSNGSLQKCDPEGPIDQFVNENVAAGMIWKLWAYQPGQTPDTESVAVEDAQGQALGSDKIFKTLTYPALVNGTLNRGYSKVDTVDFLDAAFCSGSATDAQLKAVCDTAGFPYDPANRKCP